MDPQQIDIEMRRASAEFHQLISSASPADLRRPTDGTRWTNQQLLFHMVLGYGIVRTLLPEVVSGLVELEVAVPRLSPAVR